MFRALKPLSLALLAATALTLAGCAGAPAQPEPSEPTPSDPGATSEPLPELYPGGSADENLPFFTLVLEQFAEGDTEVNGVNLVNALAESGFDKSAMQVSFDRSKTDLVADSMYISVRFDHECLIGQVVTADREVAVMHDSTVGPNKDLCLIGATRPIDW